MPVYFHVHDASWFLNDFIPALTRCRQRHSLAPCQNLCLSLLPTAQGFGERFHICADELLVSRVNVDLPYNLDVWRLIVGELLVVGAVEIPEIEQCPDMLCRLVASARCELDTHEREALAPIQQAHLGSRDLMFGAAVYRFANVGWNGVDDTARLAQYLGAVNVEEWTGDRLIACGLEVSDVDDELAYARNCLVGLQGLYRQAAQNGQVIVAELVS